MTQRDSLWVSAATFAPLKRTVVETPYRRYRRIEVRQAFGAGRVHGEMKAFRSGAVAARRRFDRTLPAGFAPYVTGALVPVFLAGTVVDRNWAGSSPCSPGPCATTTSPPRWP